MRVERSELIKCNISTAKLTTRGGVKEEIAWGVGVRPKVHTGTGDSSKLAPRGTALVRIEEHMGSATPNAKMGNIRRGAIPSTTRGRGGENSSRKQVHHMTGKQ